MEKTGVANKAVITHSDKAAQMPDPVTYADVERGLIRPSVDVPRSVSEPTPEEQAAEAAAQSRFDTAKAALGTFWDRKRRDAAAQGLAVIIINERDPDLAPLETELNAANRALIGLQNARAARVKTWQSDHQDDGMLLGYQKVDPYFKVIEPPRAPVAPPSEALIKSK